MTASSHKGEIGTQLQRAELTISVRTRRGSLPTRNRGPRRNQTCQHLIFNFQPQEQRQNRFLLFMPSPAHQSAALCLDNTSELVHPLPCFLAGLMWRGEGHHWPRGPRSDYSAGHCILAQLVSPPVVSPPHCKSHFSFWTHPGLNFPQKDLWLPCSTCPATAGQTRWLSTQSAFSYDPCQGFSDMYAQGNGRQCQFLGFTPKEPSSVCPPTQHRGPTVQLLGKLLDGEIKEAVLPDPSAQAPHLPSCPRKHYPNTSCT